MTLDLLRISSSDCDTIGVLMLDRTFFAFTLEDEQRKVKVHGETRIPAGTYELGIRHSPKYNKEFIQVLNVPGFEYIYLHSGNNENDTDGCILVGDGVRHIPNTGSVLTQSRDAIGRLNNIVMPVIKNGMKVMISIHDEVKL